MTSPSFNAIRRKSVNLVSRNKSPSLTLAFLRGFRIYSFVLLLIYLDQAFRKQELRVTKRMKYFGSKDSFNILVLQIGATH